MNNKVLKSFLSVFLVLCVMAGLSVPATAAIGLRGTKTGQMQDTSDPSNGVIEWSFTYDKTKGTASLTINGTGYMPNSIPDSWFGIQNEVQCYITSVKIGEGVKSLMEGAFAYEINLKSITLPKSLEAIGEDAFAYTGIKSLHIPAKVDYLSGRMFYNSSINEFTIDENNPKYTAYKGDIYSKDMSSFVVSAPGKYFEDSFYDIEFPSSVSVIAPYAFYMSQLMRISIPSHIKEIRNMAFAGSSIENLHIDSGLEMIYDSAFLACDKLYDIVIPDTLKYIGWYALGYVYDVDFEAIESILDEKNIRHGVITLDNYQSYVEQAGYTIDQFMICVPEINAIIYSPSGSLGEEYANEHGIPFVSTGANYSRMLSANISQSGVVIEWVKSSNAKGYRICRKSLYDTWECIGTVNNADITSFVDSSPLNNFLNEYTVIAFNENGDAYYDEEGVYCHYIKAPVLSSAVNVKGGVKLSWKGVTGAQQYNIYRKSSNTAQWKKIAVVRGGEVNFTDKTVDAGSTYFYTVSAYSETSESYYNEAGIKIIHVSNPTVKVSNVSSGVSVKWTYSYSSDFFKVYKKNTSNKWVLVYTATGKERSFVDKKASYGKQCSYKVVAGYKSYVSDTSSVGGSVIAMQSPMKFTVSDVVSGVKIKWSKCTGAKGYYVYRKNSSGKWSRIAVVNGVGNVSYIDKNVKSGTSYTYTVKAFNGSSVSTYNTKGGKTIFLTTPKIKSLKSTKNGVQVNYTSSPNAQGYYVYRKTSNSSWKIVGTVKSGKTLTFVDKTAKKGTTYTYTVRAYKNGVRSSYYASGKSIKDVY